MLKSGAVLKGRNLNSRGWKPRKTSPKIIPALTEPNNYPGASFNPGRGWDAFLQTTVGWHLRLFMSSTLRVCPGISVNQRQSAVKIRLIFAPLKLARGWLFQIHHFEQAVGRWFQQTG